MIRPLAFIDTHALAALIYLKKSVFDSDQSHSDGHVRILDATELLKTKEWAAVKTATNRVMNALAPLNKGERPTPNKVAIEKLLPGAVVPWSISPDKQTMLFRLAIVTNPACMDFSGMSAMNLLVGQLAQVVTAVPCSALNLGDTPRYHLLLEVQQPAPEEP